MAFHYILQKVLLNYDFHAFLIGNLGRKGSAAIYILSKTENDKKKAIGIPYNFNRHNSIKNDKLDHSKNYREVICSRAAK